MSASTEDIAALREARKLRSENQNLRKRLRASERMLLLLLMIWPKTPNN